MASSSFSSFPPHSIRLLRFIIISIIFIFTPKIIHNTHNMSFSKKNEEQMRQKIAIEEDEAHLSVLQKAMGVPVP